MDPELYKAATSGDVKLLQRVASEDKLLTKAPHENTALHIAARFRRADFTKEILQRRGELRWMKNSDDDTALHCAARAGCLRTVEILLQFDSPTATTVGGSWSVGLLTMQNKDGNTALHEALKNRKEDVAIQMVRAVPKLLFVRNNAEESSFLVAAKEEMVGFLKEILVGTDPSHNSARELAAAPNITSEDHIIPMPQLTADELRELIRIPDDNGKIALHYAAWRNNAEIVYMILKTDSLRVPYMVDKNGYSPLHAAVAFGKESSTLKLLEYCPDTIEQLDLSGRNVLHIGLLHGRCEIIEILVKRPQIEGLLDGTDKDGNTPIHLATNLQMHNPTLIEKKIELDMIRNEDYRKMSIKRHVASLRPQRMPDVAPMKKIDLKGIENQQFLKGIENQQQVVTVIASLIATVSFAAAFTLPGGYRSSSEPNPGTAILASKPAFKAFVLLDTLAMNFSMFAIIFYMSAWRPTIMQNIPAIAVLILNIGDLCTLIACICMLIALSAGLFAVVADESMELAIAVIVISCLLPLFLLLVVFYFLRKIIRLIKKFVDIATQELYSCRN